jgi:hypothetical protein
MVAWICETAQKVLDLLPASRRCALRAKIGLREEEIHRWQEIRGAARPSASAPPAR